MRMNWKDVEDLTLLVSAGYASTEQRMKSWCETCSIRPSKLVEEIGRNTVEYWANFWKRGA